MTTFILTMILPACAAEVGAQTYTGFYTGRILPTPQHAVYQDAVWPLIDSGAARCRIVLAPDAGSPERLAAAEIAARLSHLSGGVAVPIEEGAAEPRPGLVSFALAVAPEAAGVEAVAEAYRIRCPEDTAGGRLVIVEGYDGAGVYFGAQSLVQLTERVGDQVVFHPAAVRDWPTFRLRSFKTGGAYDPGGDSRQMGLWAPFAKYNCYNICYTTLGADKWVAPPPEYVEHVQTLTRHLRARGLDTMPFVNPYYLWKEHIEVSDEEDLAKLFAACRIGPDAGGTRVMLCLDDFASEPQWNGPRLYVVRSERDRARFADDLAAVNVAMINDLHRRLKQAFPAVTLYVVPPYYWTPAGNYREEGERNLRALGREVDPEVVFVWTGPQVRSAAISERDVEHYQGLLGGRRVMLWDNSIYMHHRPPHYFLDPFVTRYAPRFWELASGEVHYNAGGGEIYKCGLLTTADYLWNPTAYDPSESLRTAVAMIAGPEVTDDLLAFRDVFYEVYDGLATQLGTPAKFLERCRAMTSRPFDDADLAEVTALLDREQELAERIAARCANAALVEEVRARVASHAGYREGLALLAKLPPLSEADAVNIAPNPTADEEAGRPADWGLYAGAGGATLSSADGRRGRCGRLVANRLHDWPDGRQSINVAMMIGPTNGYRGENTPEVLPLHVYHFGFWLKGTAPRVVVSFVTWDASGERRGLARLDLEPFSASAEWTFYSGRFITPADAARGALKIGIEGFLEQGGGLGEILVDDVYVGRSRAAAQAMGKEPPE